MSLCCKTISLIITDLGDAGNAMRRQHIYSIFITQTAKSPGGAAFIFTAHFMNEK
ncbi:Uncharacterized protein dnm_036810 [Desulfonema magnum]|uniref:Uncharacterized protein n=1 Tax=Desulfonema magnum TaxID=45655 RepID=A0A975BLX3_9BACT|nr:Uncharacterized protein dnm_036810 [Desulfonema magnum]